MPIGRILALDVAKRTGVADGTPGHTPLLSFVDFGGRELDTDHDVFERAAKWLMRMLREDIPSTIAIEAPVAKYDSSMLMGLRGLVIGIARAHTVPVLEATVQEWRKYFLGRGNFKGDVAKAECVRLCNHLGWALPSRSKNDARADHNAAEAGGIWLWACARIAPKHVHRHEPLFITGKPT